MTKTKIVTDWDFWDPLAYHDLRGRGILVRYFKGTPRDPIELVGEVECAYAVDSYDHHIWEGVDYRGIRKKEDRQEAVFDFLLGVRPKGRKTSDDVGSDEVDIVSRGDVPEPFLEWPPGE